MGSLPFCHVTLSSTRPDRRSRPAGLNSLGDHIRERRLDLCLQNKHLARKLGVDETTIHNWEDKGIAPAIRFMPRILEFLGYDPCAAGQPRSLAEQLKALRTRLGLFRKRLAALLGIDHSNLAAWENGTHQPAKRSLKRIAEFLVWHDHQLEPTSA
jgi:DNA-binding transcriptional regulator YiaG